MPNRQTLTLKYRPQTFAELLIQDHVRETLTRAIERDRIANAYLFSGPRGVGKTTTARILAKCLNCISFDRPTVTPCNRCSACNEIAESRSIDVLEIDGASERRIDDVRDLRDGIRYSPSSLRYKVYIIDEVHMLTKEAFNAILKTLEEPPAHARFIFATTEPHKLPLTIISRCQRFDFRKATVAEIVNRLAWIAEHEQISISREALAAIAERADGAVRDAESMLEQVAMYSPGDAGLAEVEDLFGLVPARLYREYTDLLLKNDRAGLVAFAGRLHESGHDFIEFFRGLVGHFRQLLRLQYSDADAHLPKEELALLNDQARSFPRAALLPALRHLTAGEETLRRSSVPTLFLEIVSLELCDIVNKQPPASKDASDQKKSDRPAREEERKPGHVRETGGCAARSNDNDCQSDGVAGPKDAKAVWQDLLQELHQHKPMLAGILDICVPLSFDNYVLRLALPHRNPVAAEQLKTNHDTICRILKTVVGCEVRLELVATTPQCKPDPLLERVSRVLGPVDELTQNTSEGRQHRQSHR